MNKNTKIILIIAGIATGIFLWTKYHVPSGPIALELLKEDERHITVERDLTKKTEFESKTYTEEYKVKLECTFVEKHYTYAPSLAYVVATCKEKSEKIYTPLARQTVQACVAQRAGFTKKIIPITGMTLEDEGSFFVVPGDHDVFYLNIPIDMVNFLNTFEEILRTDKLMRESVSQEKVVEYNLINALIHCGLRIITEMDADNPHVCAYHLKSLDDVDIAYDVKISE